MKLARYLLLFISFILSASLLLIIYFSISNSNFLGVSWLNIAERFQTLLGGLGVLVAGLLAYCASTLEVYETRNKNEEDKSKQKQDTLISVAISINTLYQQIHSRLEDIKYYSENYTDKRILVSLYKTLKISIPQQLSTYFEHASLFPNDAHYKITTLIGMANIYIIEHPVWVENRELSKNSEESRAILKKDMKIKNFSSITTEEEKQKVHDEFASALIDAQSIGWKRAASALVPMHRAALEVMQLLEPTKDWKFDPAPYPPCSPHMRG